MGKPQDLFQTVRILILGCENVGKTSLIERFIVDKFDENQYYHTDSLEIPWKKLGIVDEEVVHFVIFESPGKTYQDVIRHTTVDAFILVYSVASHESFKHMPTYHQNLKETSPHAPICLVATHVDADPRVDRQVTAEEYTELALSLNVDSSFHASAKWGLNVDEVFLATARHVLSKRKPSWDRTTTIPACTGGPAAQTEPSCFGLFKSLLRQNK